jgi:hypothetical protein
MQKFEINDWVPKQRHALTLGVTHLIAGTKIGGPSRKVVRGTITKHVDCANCGRSYEYEMSRAAVGTSARTAASQVAADAQALADANAKLKAALASECDPVCCPSCGALTPQMNRYRRKRLGAAFACMGSGLLILIGAYLLMLLMQRVLLVVTLLGVLCLLLGLAILLVGAPGVLIPKRGRP